MMEGFLEILEDENEPWTHLTVGHLSESHSSTEEFSCSMICLICSSFFPVTWVFIGEAIVLFHLDLPL